MIDCLKNFWLLAKYKPAGMMKSSWTLNAKSSVLTTHCYFFISFNLGKEDKKLKHRGNLLRNNLQLRDAC